MAIDSDQITSTFFFDCFQGTSLLQIASQVEVTSGNQKGNVQGNHTKQAICYKGNKRHDEDVEKEPLGSGQHVEWEMVVVEVPALADRVIDLLRHDFLEAGEGVVRLY